MHLFTNATPKNKLGQFLHLFYSFSSPSFTNKRMFGYWKVSQILSVFICCWGINLRTTPVTAQSITSAPDGTGTVINHNGNIYDIGGGTQAGANLFHSFAEFGLNPQEVANFLSLPQINNILGRVTGGNPSIIQGLIQLSGGNSNLYLMNPAGLVFHQGASLDVPGSFGVTTATRMGFGDGYFHADGDNLYSNLTGNPTSLIFDQNNPSWIINEADLAVNSGASLWAVGGGIVSTGTITGEEITLAAVPGKSQVKLNHEGMVLNLVLEAAPVGGINSSVTGIQSVDIPRYLTGGNEVSHINYAIVEADGTVRLINRDTVIADGDTVIAGEVNAEDITLMAAGRVKPTDYDLVSNHPLVVLFPEEIGDNLETTFIDEGINDYQGEEAYQAFLYGGKPGTISQVVTHDEGEGISTVTRMLAKIAEQGGKVSAIHLLTEGNEGNFWLGRDYVDSENIGEYQQELQQWGAALTAGADILLYSCFTALGVTGEQLISSLAQLTGADVAASTDLTGSEALGGNWVFEKQTGAIEARLGFEQQVLADFTGKLEVFTATDAASLIAAINAANMNAEADRINLTEDITLTAVADNANGDNGLPSITAAERLTINGMGFTIARDADAPNFRLLRIAEGAELVVNNTTLTNGFVNGAEGEGSGGGILNLGTLTLNNSTVSGNRAVLGGGIYNYGNVEVPATLTLNNSTVSGNRANQRGGGIYNLGFDENATTVALNNSTVSGNRANQRGGGIYNYGGGENAVTVTLSNSTVSLNEADFGGGIYNSVGEVNNGANVIIANSIVAENNATEFDPDVGSVSLDAAPITDNGNNLIGIDTTGAFTTSTLVGSLAEPLNPGLAPLRRYGGPTRTHALLPDSPALDAGSNALIPMGFTTDQRGANRITNTTVDIGAFEVQGYALTAAVGDEQTTTVNTNFAENLRIQVVETFVNRRLPAPDIEITLTPPDTGASANLGNITLITNDEGIANTTASANTIAGNYQVPAAATGIDGITGVSFNLTNTPGAANALSLLAGNNQNTTVNTALTDSLQVQVTDEFGNAVPDVTVTLTPPTTGASSSLGSTTLITDAFGVATTTATANTIAGTYQLVANVTGLTGVNFDLTNSPGAAAVLSILAGNSQSTDVNTAFADSLQVQVTDEFGNAVPDVTVTLTPPDTGASASLGSAILTTDVSGLASTNITANSIAGNYQVGANIGVAEINIDLTNIATSVTDPGDPTPVVVPDDSTPVVVPGDSTLVIVPGDSDLVVVSGDSDPVVVPSNSDPVIVPGDSSPVIVVDDTTTNTTTNSVPDFTPVWQSVLEELPESELEDSACQSISAIAINYPQEEEGIALNEEMETEVLCTCLSNQNNRYQQFEFPEAVDDDQELNQCYRLPVDRSSDS
ncbi:MAG: DUF4347 domain-containing protein [Symploca sp. SIO2G7]|nr:DUF4347 domain-containing protein [Symploca sp. SIO2G7]